MEGVITTPISTFRSRNGLVITKFIVNTMTTKISVVAFNQGYIKFNYETGDSISLVGKYDVKENTLSVSKVNTKVNNAESSDYLVPIYSSITGLNNTKINSIIISCLEQNKDMRDYEYLMEMHAPKNRNFLLKSIYNLKYNEFKDYLLKVRNESKKRVSSLDNSIDFEIEVHEEFTRQLPFKLTDSQEKAVQKLGEHLSSNFSMNTLLLGDVGCGKTVVALSIALQVLNKGYQVAIMAPTELLAKQLYRQVELHLSKFNIGLLISNITQTTKRRVKTALSIGAIDIVVGTHAILSEDVQFNNLGFVIIDEQHRFGVSQRDELISKGINVQQLSMSATPIPRSLAQTMFNIIDTHTISEKPISRVEIQTRLYQKETRDEMILSTISELEKGNQVYVVAPLVEEKEINGVTNIVDVYEYFEELLGDKFVVGALHSGTKRKDIVMDKFLDKEIDILVSTTVVEVGIDVPNATVMMILNAERFGMSTLHQLRGRVGRSDKKSYCFLYSNTTNHDSLLRINKVKDTSCGFKLAEADMINRGSGDFFGTLQSGNPDFKIFNYTTDQDIASKVIEDINQNKE